MGSRTNPRFEHSANATSDFERSGEASSEQSIPTASSSITWLSDDAVETQPTGGESSTWERLLNEVAKAPGTADIVRSHADEEAETLGEGEAVGEYRVVCRLGRGTFGTVYQAVHPVIGKEVAVKVLNTRFAADAHVVRRFVEEARAVNRIRHPNIVDVFGFGELPDGRKFFVMELLSGETLASMLEREGAVPLEPAIAILKDVASALDATHARGILHRDLSPGNIFLVKDATGGMAAKLLDFGVAKMLNDSNGLGTQTGALIGTPAYMSPEQCRGSVLDPKSDIYSLGIIAHELLTGERPFSGTTVEHFVTKHIYSPPPRISECKPGLPPALDKPILRMLAKKPNERPESASAGVAELERVFREMCETGGKRRFPKPALYIGVGLALAIPAGLYAGGMRPSSLKQSAPESNVAATNSAVVSPTARMADSQATPSPAPAPSPSQPPPATEPSSRADTVLITIKGLPAGTAVFRGKEQIGKADDGLVMARSTEEVQLTLYARGYKPEAITLVPDRNRELRPTLTRARRAPRSAASPGVLGELEY